MSDDPRLALRSCDRVLSGHGRTTPKEALTALAAEAGADERADVYGTGALIEDLEREIAELLGKPAAVFMPSGHMAQQIALRIWSERKGSGGSDAGRPRQHDGRLRGKPDNPTANLE